MSANGNGMTVEEASEILRQLRVDEGTTAIREFFNTGGGLSTGQQSDLKTAIETVGRDRAAQILKVDVPSEMPGEQITLGGDPTFGATPEERPEPVPEGVASLSEFTGGDEPDELTVEEAENVVVTVANMEGADAIEAFLEPGEVASLGMGQSVQLSDALEILGEERVRELAGLEADEIAQSPTVNLPIDAERGPQGTVAFGPPEGSVSIEVAEEIEDAILELLDRPGRFDIGDRVGVALVTNEDVTTRRELVSVGRTFSEAQRRAEEGNG